MEYNSSQTLQNGKGMIILHRYNDSLWELSKNISINGFSKDIIIPLNELSSEEEGEEELNNSKKEKNNLNEDMEKIEEKENLNNEEEKNKNDENNIDKKELKEESKKVVLEEEENKKLEENENNNVEDLSKEKMDELIKLCFIEVIKNTIKDNDLPIEGSSIFSKMISMKPKNTHIDIKKSSHKKLSKLLKEMSKEKFISIKESKETIIITKINRDLDEYKKHSSSLFQDEEDEEEKKDENSKIFELYKSPSPLFPLFEYLHSEDEVSLSLIEYINQNKLETDKNHLKLNDFLINNLFNINEGIKLDQNIARKKVLDRLISKMVKYHSITLPNKDTVNHCGEIPKIKIKSTKIMGNKFITNVFGLIHFGFDLEDLTKKMKIKLSTAVSFETENINQKNPEFSIHGNFSTTFENILIQEFKIPKKYIEITGLKEKKKN